MPQQNKRWRISDVSDSKLLMTPKEDVSMTPDRPPVSVVVVQSTPLNASPLIEHDGVDAKKIATFALGDSPFPTVAMLKPRGQLPSSCVRPTPIGGRKRSAACIDSFSTESSFCTLSRTAPQIIPVALKNISRQKMIIPPETPCRESHQAATKSPRLEMDFMAIENMTLLSPAPRRLNGSSARSPSVSPKKKSFSGYIASPAHSQHSSFSSYVAPRPSHDAPRKPRSPSFDSSTGGSFSSPRKVRVKVLSQFDPTQTAMPPPTMKKSQSRMLSCNSLPYTFDDGSQASDENIPSPCRLRPLGRSNNAMVCIGDITVTPKKSEEYRSPCYPSPQKASRKFWDSSPRTPFPKINNLTPRRTPGSCNSRNMAFPSPRTPLPKVRLTPRKTPRSSESGATQTLSLSELRIPAAGDADDMGPVEASLFRGFDTSIQGYDSRCSKPTSTISPRLLFATGSQLLSEDSRRSTGVDPLLNKSIDMSTADSLRSISSYWSDSDDEDEKGFFLSHPATLLGGRPNWQNTRVSKQARR